MFKTMIVNYFRAHGKPMAPTTAFLWNRRSKYFIVITGILCSGLVIYETRDGWGTISSDFTKEMQMERIRQNGNCTVHIWTDKGWVVREGSDMIVEYEKKRLEEQAKVII